MLLKYLGFCCSKHTSSSQRHYPTVIEELCHQFSLADLRKSTNNFDENRIIARGGFGIVYKGCLQHNVATDYTVAVKRMFRGTGQGFREFKNEIELLCQLHHPNLVSLIGFCKHKDEKILVYEYMPNGSLYDHLHNRDMEPLSWKKRLEICIGAARGLHYLHAGAKHTILHLDIKPNHILLDNNMVPKLVDFGPSLLGHHFMWKPKPIPIPDDEFTTFIGTYGYTAPEIAVNMTFTDKGDVYSFGFVLLEVVCTDRLNMIEQGQKCSVEESIDLNIKGKITPECREVFMDVTERCLKYDPNERPTMGEAEVQLEHALSLQEEADIRKASGDYSLLSTTIINLGPEEAPI